MLSMLEALERGRKCESEMMVGDMLRVIDLCSLGPLQNNSFLHLQEVGRDLLGRDLHFPKKVNLGIR